MMQIVEAAKPQGLVLQISGRLDSNTARDLEAVLPARVQSQKAVLVDLSQVQYVSSAGLRVLLKGAKGAKASGCNLMLSGLAPDVYEVFDVSGFATIFSIYPTADAALASVG